MVNESQGDSLLWQMAAAIQAPSLILWGEQSTLLTRDLVDRMLAAIPNSSLTSFKTGHYIPREVPEEFTRVLDEFLSGETATESGGKDRR